MILNYLSKNYYVILFISSYGNNSKIYKQNSNIYIMKSKRISQDVEHSGIQHI